VGLSARPVINQITGLSEQYRDNQVIVSCRTATYVYSLENFSEIEMADFSPDQIESFISSWFHNDRSKAVTCWGEVNSHQNIMELASVPLLLTMICLAYEETGTLSSSRAELYEDAVDALLRKWDSSRQRRRDEPYRQLTPKRKTDLFSFVAAHTFEEGRFFFREEHLLDLIKRYIQYLPELGSEDENEVSERILNAIEGHHGIFIERAKKVHSFAHLTFQEYFTANYIALKGPDSLKNLTELYLDMPKWREVFILVANILPDSDEFTIGILEKMVDMGFPRGYVSGLRASIEVLKKHSSRSAGPSTRPFLIDVNSGNPEPGGDKYTPSLTEVDATIRHARASLKLDDIFRTTGNWFFHEIVFSERAIFADFGKSIIGQMLAKRNFGAVAVALGQSVARYCSDVLAIETYSGATSSVEYKEFQQKEEYLRAFADLIAHVVKIEEIGRAEPTLKDIIDRLSGEIDMSLMNARSYDRVRRVLVAEMLLDILRTPARMHQNIRKAALRMLWSLGAPDPIEGPGGTAIRRVVGL
jgi:hypothetical protein